MANAIVTMIAITRCLQGSMANGEYICEIDGNCAGIKEIGGRIREWNWKLELLINKDKIGFLLKLRLY